MFGLRIDEDTQDWVIDSFFWAIDNQLLTPNTRAIHVTKSNFPAPNGPHQEVAQALIHAIQKHLGIENQDIVAAPLNGLPAEYRHQYGQFSSVGGTWQSDGTQALITYDPETITQRRAFLSTLVHEVMHHRLHMTALDMPGGPEAEELSTDLHCITTGFGALQMQGAEEAGWQGYLRQETRAFAYAVFLLLTEPDSNTRDNGLPSRSSRLVKKASKLLRNRQDDMHELRDALHSKG
ncbi:hypothetical protein [uncultured Tateyamaria sp.]|uniref:hypothetical protein n=1 Tax=uncultured Tateyamaria sp. TaxID=455651 RepID=UPI00263133D0|nr:hypothetical protein [uncultured Tateyamaria sp.]